MDTALRRRIQRLIDSKNNCVNIIPVLAESYGDEDEGYFNLLLRFLIEEHQK